jgi:hypothetical protein
MNLPIIKEDFIHDSIASQQTKDIKTYLFSENEEEEEYNEEDDKKYRELVIKQNEEEEKNIEELKKKFEENLKLKKTAIIQRSSKQVSVLANDVYYHIFKFLEFPELLILSKNNLLFYEILSSKIADKLIWKNIFKNLEFKDMNAGHKYISHLHSHQSILEDNENDHDFRDMVYDYKKFEYSKKYEFILPHDTMGSDHSEFYPFIAFQNNFKEIKPKILTKEICDKEMDEDGYESYSKFYEKYDSFDFFKKECYRELTFWASNLKFHKFGIENLKQNIENFYSLKEIWEEMGIVNPVYQKCIYYWEDRDVINTIELLFYGKTLSNTFIGFSASFYHNV